MTVAIMALGLAVAAVVGLRPAKRGGSIGRLEALFRDPISCVCNPSSRLEVPIRAGRSGPLRIAILQDKSRSALWTRTEQVSSRAIATVYPVLLRTGGELAVGVIDDRSNGSLVRLRVGPPPDAPVLPSENSNPYFAEKAIHAYEAQRAAYRIRRAAWQAQVNNDIAAFEGQVSSMLSPAPYAHQSDVWSGIARADLFLNEPGSPSRRYLILVTDGRANVSFRGAKVLSSAAEVLLVNGSGAQGDLRQLHPLRFESFASAANYIANRR